MTLEEMRSRKKELGYTNQMIADLAHVPLGTVQKIFSGLTKAPRRDTLLALEGILEPGNGENEGSVRHAGHAAHMGYAGYAGNDGYAAGMQGKRPDMVREADAPYNSGTYAYSLPEEKYTIDDYYALPDERRVELIDGAFYDMAPPSTLHQALLGQLYLHFAACVEGHPECELFFAPLDVRLDNDNYTMVQPDLLIVCGRADNDIRRINGAPDFIVEILSQSNKDHDLVRKLDKYLAAGVREYWIADPEKRKVLAYDLVHDMFPEVYTFQDEIPVLISEGTCKIDFAAISEKLKKYLV